MAYNKRTWKGRQGTGLNKFSINGATPVTIINQPDSIIEQGDALSAGNMNDLEDRIYTAFEEEATARDDADTALKAAIDKNTAEIENLKQTTGQQEITVSYPDDGNYSSLMPNKVPLSVANYAEVPRFRGKTRAWNQLVPLDVLTTRDFGGFKITNNNNGSWTLNGTASSNIAEYLTGAINLPIGHKILFGYVNLGSAISGLLMRDQYSFAGTGALTIWESTVVTSAFAVIVDSGTVLNNVKIVPIIRDLTLIFGAGNEPATVADALAQLPALGQYDAYDAGSLVDTVVSGAKSVGVNIWDGVYEGGYYDASGVKQPASTYTCNSNPVRVKPNTEYYITLGVYICFYDINMNFILRDNTGNLQFTTPANCAYITFYQSNSDWQDNIQICLYSLPVAIRTTYHHYKSDTLSLPEPVTLRSAGSVADELDVESGVVTRKVGAVDLSTLIWTRAQGSGYGWWQADISDIKRNDGVSVGNVSHAEYSAGTINQATMLPQVTTYMCPDNSGDRIIINDYFLGSTQPSGILNYELSTPTTESIDPVPYNFLEVEGDGTVETIQTQSPVIDNCLDVTYDIIPA